MGQDLERYDDIIDGELVDDLCDCGKPGELVVDPVDSEVNDRTTMRVMCDDCHAQACLDV